MSQPSVQLHNSHNEWNYLRSFVCSPYDARRPLARIMNKRAYVSKTATTETYGPLLEVECQTICHIDITDISNNQKNVGVYCLTWLSFSTKKNYPQETVKAILSLVSFFLFCMSSFVNVYCCSSSLGPSFLYVCFRLQFVDDPII